MKNRIGIVTTTYPQYKLEEALKGISNTGFKFIEIVSAIGHVDHVLPRPEDLDKRGANKIINLCKTYDLKIYCVAGHMRLMRENSVSDFKKVIDAAELFGANFVTTDTGEVTTKEDENFFFNDISELGNYANTKNVTICLETHGHWLSNGEKGAEIIKTINHPNVRINYDTGNSMMYGNKKAEEDIEYALPYMSFMHLKERNGGFGEWNFPPLGDGNIDFKKLFNLIKDYKGPISVEIEFEGKPHTINEINQAVKKSYDFLKSFGFVS